ncbi:HEAT repeat domain-containing protein [Microcoleus sp. B3-A4]|uniref:HEAT repeat domain-containing protein n=1 Tax=Microcoleus sp. B3-A4 TaxID=2818653 RepID=UPI002FD18C49
MNDILGHIGFANKNAINFLIRIIDNSNSFDDLKQDAIDWIRRRAIDSLGKIATGDLKVVKALTQVIYGDFPIENRYKAAINLGGTATYNPIIILHLIEFICTGWVRRNEQNNSLGTVSNFSDFERPELNAW